jgi:hypothetical protein
LARVFSCSPTTFLAMPVTEVQRHLHWTNKLLAHQETRHPN